MVTINPVSYSTSKETTSIKAAKSGKDEYERQLEAMETVSTVVGELKSVIEILQKPGVSADNVKDFVNAYNKFLDTYYAVTRYIPVKPGYSPSPDNGPLIANAMLKMLQGNLNNSLGSKFGTGNVNSLNSLGISVELKNNKISLAVDDSKLQKVLAENPAQVISFLAGDGTNTGFATKFNKLLETGEKNITAATDSLNELIRRNS